jgi:hypothetical protein
MVKQNLKINGIFLKNKILWGEKWKEVKRIIPLLIFLPKATMHGTFQGPLYLEPSIGHQLR